MSEECVTLEASNGGGAVDHSLATANGLVLLCWIYELETMLFNSLRKNAAGAKLRRTERAHLGMDLPPWGARKIRRVVHAIGLFATKTKKASQTQVCNIDHLLRTKEGARQAIAHAKEAFAKTGRKGHAVWKRTQSSIASERRILMLRIVLLMLSIGMGWMQWVAFDAVGWMSNPLIAVPKEWAVQHGGSAESLSQNKFQEHRSATTGQSWVLAGADAWNDRHVHHPVGRKESDEWSYLGTAMDSCLAQGVCKKETFNWNNLVLALPSKALKTDGARASEAEFFEKTGLTYRFSKKAFSKWIWAAWILFGFSGLVQWVIWMKACKSLLNQQDEAIRVLHFTQILRVRLGCDAIQVFPILAGVLSLCWPSSLLMRSGPSGLILGAIAPLMWLSWNRSLIDSNPTFEQEALDAVRANLERGAPIVERQQLVRSIRKPLWTRLRKPKTHPPLRPKRRL